MNDMRITIAPKSDQLNADDLIGMTKTIRVTKVLISASSEQPVAVHFENDNGKPYMVCKSMRRVLVQCWGPDANVYIGRSMTLYRDDKVKFGGMAVGGIRISHMSNIERDVTMALTESKANRKPFTVKPLVVEAPKETKKGETIGSFLDALAADLGAAQTQNAVDAIIARPKVQSAYQNLTNGALTRLKAIISDALARFALPVEEEVEEQFDGRDEPEART